MERINDHTIRVMVENEDLQDRGTSVRDLLSDRNKIESFFYNILSELDADTDFVDNDKVSFQVLPNQNGLELFISRVDDQTAVNEILEALSNDQKAAESSDQETVENADEQRIDDLSPSDYLAMTGRDEEAANDQTSVRRHDVIALSNFDALLALSCQLNDLDCETAAYRYEDRYYLVVDALNQPLDEQSAALLTATAAEFGQQVKISEDLLKEHGQVLFGHQAITQLNQIFA
ncbi:adaptor protein MecA [Leuconostocaceae bacterium ESL0958]|nr:adaptor protein MecA [Leuconostocaceae bacterium ESL0958]